MFKLNYLFQLFARPHYRVYFRIVNTTEDK